MSFMDVFLSYLKNEISVSLAEQKIEKMLPILRTAGKSKEYAKASLCMTYFKRYHQYNRSEERRVGKECM